MRSSQSKIRDLRGIKEDLSKWKQNGQKIVFTNGCFDLVHLGHLDYLEKARLLGDRLIVGLNSDQSVTRIKGENRPIQDELSRSRLLASLEYVDGVVIFEEDTPESVIKELLPDILVKGNDYEISNIVGADIVMENGGTVKTIKLVEGYSTSKIVRKIKKTDI